MNVSVASHCHWLEKNTNTGRWLPRSEEVAEINLSMWFIGLWNLSSVGICQRLEFRVRAVFRWYKQNFVRRMLREWPEKEQTVEKNTDWEIPKHKVSKIIDYWKWAQKSLRFYFVKNLVAFCMCNKNFKEEVNSNGLIYSAYENSRKWTLG